jgi:hypothetical protein
MREGEHHPRKLSSFVAGTVEPLGYPFSSEPLSKDEDA